MNISLKKSAGLQQEILKRILELKPRGRGGYLELSAGDVTISAFEDPNEIIAERGNEINTNLERIQDLEEVLRELRDATGRTNAECGVTKLLADLNFYQRSYDHLHFFKSVKPQVDTLIIKKKLAQIENPEVEKRMDSEVNTSVFSKETIDLRKTELLGLSRSIQETKDQLLELNYTTKIEIGEGSLSTLQFELMV